MGNARQKIVNSVKAVEYRVQTRTRAGNWRRRGLLMANTQNYKFAQIKKEVETRNAHVRKTKKRLNSGN